MVNKGKHFNVKHSIIRADDKLPKRLLEEKGGVGGPHSLIDNP
jgi:hypothetical protein